jgi:hypothetical protein
MSNGRGGKAGRSERGRGSGRGGRGRGHNYTGTTSTPKKGLCTTLGSNVFDYGQKSSADQMRISWEKLVQYVGITYGQDISNELQNKKTVTVPDPCPSTPPGTQATHSCWFSRRSANRNALAGTKLFEAI